MTLNGATQDLFDRNTESRTQSGVSIEVFIRRAVALLRFVYAVVKIVFEKLNETSEEIVQAMETKDSSFHLRRSSSVPGCFQGTMSTSNMQRLNMSSQTTRRANEKNEHFARSKM